MNDYCEILLAFVVINIVSCYIWKKNYWIHGIELLSILWYSIYALSIVDIQNFEMIFIILIDIWSIVVFIFHLQYKKTIGD